MQRVLFSDVFVASKCTWVKENYGFQAGVFIVVYLKLLEGENQFIQDSHSHPADLQLRAVSGNDVVISCKSVTFCGLVQVGTRLLVAKKNKRLYMSVLPNRRMSLYSIDLFATPSRRCSPAWARSNATCNAVNSLTRQLCDNNFAFIRTFLRWADLLLFKKQV